MPRVHFLNVGNGDCSIIEHFSGRVTMIDICGGQVDAGEVAVDAILRDIFEKTMPQTRDFRMRDYPTNPFAYLTKHNIKAPFRFILTHPDMDHLDGFAQLVSEVGITNFWDNGVRRERPSFEGGHYVEADWDAYVEVLDGKREGITLVTPLAGARFAFANKGGVLERGDALSIVAPDRALVHAANETADPNDGSYVIVYRTAGGNIVFGGDADDATWEYVTTHHAALVRNCAVLIAPHHGRDSDRSYEFLDVLNPALTLFGIAKSEHLGYDAYNERGLLHITNNQAGNVVLVPRNGHIEVFVENRRFASTLKSADLTRTECGAYYIGHVSRKTSVAA